MSGVLGPVPGQVELLADGVEGGGDLGQGAGWGRLALVPDPRG